MTNDQLEALITEQVRKALGAKAQPSVSEAQPQNPTAALYGELAPTIEHSVLNPDMTEEKLLAACRDALTYGFANVCVTPYFVSTAARYLEGSKSLVSAPVGFPHGAASLMAKNAEIRYCIQCGAKELDLSLNIVAAKSGKWEDVYRELCEMRNVAGNRAVCKAIFEQGLYTDDEKKRLLDVIEKAKVPYLKISNALTGKKASCDDVVFVRKQIGSRIGIKIDGGIKTAQTVRDLMAAGAQRFGCSASVAIVTGK